MLSYSIVALTRRGQKKRKNKPLGVGREFTGTGKSLEEFARVKAIDYGKLFFSFLFFFWFVSTVLNRNFRQEIKI